ncbi:hypothetical protein [Roseimaritima ulvae]|uniref:Uncharacterized protein n=1 Tax=Roseimaritima ulvae TaxID=980254 RepID=A0A5B9QV55_9BACT|nr:hypothetical protein [Roseimaritima ulvae]QEG42904.1 hypothetical protein UC8_49460 [Roseimaritima ulvae]
MTLLADLGELAGALTGVTACLMALAAIVQVKTLSNKVHELEKRLDETK